MALNNSTVYSHHGTSGLSSSDFLLFSVFFLRYAIALFGLVSNCTVIFCVCFYRKLRKVRNYLVANLALIDTLILIMDISVFIPSDVPNMERSWLVADNMGLGCSASVLGNTLTFLGLIALGIVATDRFVYIMLPLHYHLFRNQWVKIVTGSWVAMGTCHVAFGFVCTCPAVNQDREDFYNLANASITAVWFSIICILYSIIYYRAYRQNASLERRGTEESRDSRGCCSSTQKRIIFGYMLIVGISFLTFLFVQFLGIMFVMFDEGSPGFLTVLEEIAQLQLTINSSINPVIYAATQNLYRKAFISLYKCKSMSRRDQLGSYNAYNRTGVNGLTLDVD